MILSNIPKEYLEGLSFYKQQNGYLTFKRVYSSYCPICQVTHDKENSLYAYTLNDCIWLKCRRGAMHGNIKGVNIGSLKNFTYEDILKKFIQNPTKETNLITDSQNIYTNEIMQDYEFDHETLAIKAPMGAGKSQKLAKWINEQKSTSTIRMISFRRSFTQEMKGTYQLKSYLDIERHAIKMNENPHVIIHCESLNRLEAIAPDILIIDEIDSVLNQFFASTMRDYNACWMMFKYLVKFSKKVIIVDAMLTQ